jgi:hypothetical protein
MAVKHVDAYPCELASLSWHSDSANRISSSAGRVRKAKVMKTMVLLACVLAADALLGTPAVNAQTAQSRVVHKVTKNPLPQINMPWCGIVLDSGVRECVYPTLAACLAVVRPDFCVPRG